jgi:hypothetical protein
MFERSHTLSGASAVTSQSSVEALTTHYQPGRDVAAQDAISLSVCISLVKKSIEKLEFEFRSRFPSHSTVDNKLKKPSSSHQVPDKDVPSQDDPISQPASAESPTHSFIFDI